MKRAPPVIICVYPDCGRKANNLCPNSLCLAHCHDRQEMKGFQACKRHQREWENKQKPQPSRRRDATAGSGAATSSAVGVSSGFPPSLAPASAALAAAAPTAAKRARPAEPENDAFCLLDRSGPTRKCPVCDKLVPDSGSFFALHLGLCDATALTETLEGERALPPVLVGGRPDERLAVKATAETEARVKRAEELLGAVFGVKSEVKQEQQEHSELEGQREDLLQHLTMAVNGVTTAAEREAVPQEPPEGGGEELPAWGKALVRAVFPQDAAVPLVQRGTYIRL